MHNRIGLVAPRAMLGNIVPLIALLMGGGLSPRVSASRCKQNLHAGGEQARAVARLRKVAVMALLTLSGLWARATSQILGPTAALVVALSLLPMSAAGQPEKAYWADYGTGKVQRANLDGSSIEDLVTSNGVGAPYGIALDLIGGKIYWTDPTPSPAGGRIQRANFDASNVEDLVTGLQHPVRIALDLTNGKMYWTDIGPDPANPALPPKIQRANLDGSSPEDLVTDEEAYGIALDVAGGKMYWPDRNTWKIRRANLDGSSPEDLVTTGLGSPSGIALDLSGSPQKMYWLDAGSSAKIQRANLDGSSVEDLVTAGLDEPMAIALDPFGGKIYWTDEGAWPYNPLFPPTIRRANLDGSGVEGLITSGLNNPQGIGLDAGAGKMYWTSDNFGMSIQRANLDGSTVERVVVATHPVGVALDLSGGEMYWTDGGLGKIRRANLDGSSAVDLVTGLNFPMGIALDLSGVPNKMYWVDGATGKIQRANLDGSGLQDLVTGLNFPMGVALDPSGSEMYWAAQGDQKIQRANLDGSSITDLFTALTAPAGVALDPPGGKIYWTNGPDQTTDNIQRANLDGTGVVEDLVTGVVSFGMALDLSSTAPKMYWTDVSTQKILRANLDGSAIEDLVTTGLGMPIGIALALRTATPTPTPTPTGTPTAAPTETPDPSTPWPIGPSGTITDTTPVFYWTAVAGASKYSFAVYDITAGGYVFMATVPGATSYTPGTALNPTHRYKWKVRAYAGGWGAFSAWKWFKYGTGVPAAVAPSGTIADTTPTFSWTAVPGAWMYFLAVYDNTAGNYAIRTTVAGAPSYTPISPLDNTHSYKWKVRAYAGGWGAYCGWMAFNYGIGVPTPQSPAGTIADTTPTFSWTAVAGASKYHLAVYDKTAGSYPMLQIVTGATTYTPAAALDNTHAYKWKVRAYVGPWGLFSGWRHFGY